MGRSAIGKKIVLMFCIFLISFNIFKAFSLFYFISLEMAKWLTGTCTSLLHKINFSTMCAFFGTIIVCYTEYDVRIVHETIGET